MRDEREPRERRYAISCSPLTSYLLPSSPDRVQQQIALFVKFFSDRAEVHRLIGKLAIFCDFGLVEHFESIALEQFETAPAVECNYLGLDLFDAMIVKIAEIGLEELTIDQDRLYFREKVGMKMPDRPRSSGHFAPRF